MKFTVEDKNLLQRELGFIRLAVAERRATIPALTYTRIEASGKRVIRVTGTDLDQTLTCETTGTVQKAGAIALPTRKLFDILNELPDAPVVFERKDNDRVSITCGSAKFLVAGLDVKDFPELPKFKESIVQVPSDVLGTMIERTRFALTQVESQFVLSGAKFILRKKGVRMVTTDGHRLALVDNRTTHNEAELDCLIPRNALIAVAKLAAAHEGAVGFNSDENHLYFEMGPRRLVARQLTGQFPNYELILPKGNDKKIGFDCAELLQAIRRVAVMADDRSRAMRLEFTKNNLIVRAEENEQGAAEETMEIKYEGDPITIGINSTYMIDYLGVLGSGAISFEFKGARDAVNIRSMGEPGFNSYTVIMPLNLGEPAQAAKNPAKPKAATGDEATNQEQVAEEVTMAEAA